MQIIKTKHHGTELDVIADGRFIFIDAFHGLVAIAKFDDDDTKYEKNVWNYEVERTLAIDPSTIERIIKNYVDKARKTYATEPLTHKFHYNTIQIVDSLPYSLEINLTKK